MKCPECGGNLTFHFNQNNHDIKFFSCNNHNSGLRKCSSPHYIRLDFLEQVVLYEVKRLACFANEYESDFIKAMMGRSAKVAQNDRVVIFYNCIGAFEMPDRRKIPEQDILLKTKKGVALSYAPAQIAI